MGEKNIKIFKILIRHGFTNEINIDKLLSLWNGYFVQSTDIFFLRNKVRMISLKVFTFLMKFSPSWKMLIIYLEKFELFVWLFFTKLVFFNYTLHVICKGWNTSIDTNMIYINEKWLCFRYIYFVTNFIHAWTLFQSRFQRKREREKITWREIYVTFENNFWKYFPVEKKNW